MSTYAIYDSHLKAQLSEGAPFVEGAIYDPDGIAEPVFGYFDENSRRANKDGGNVRQYMEGARFILMDIDDLNIDIYEDKILKIVSTGDEYIIENYETDTHGVQALWLR